MRIGIVNDLPIAVKALERCIQDDGRHRVAWVAVDGADAVTKAAADAPDMILMDLVMPKMNGAEATRRIMKSNPCPILVVTASVGGNSDLVYEAMGHGALDAVNTPCVTNPKSVKALMHKISIIQQLTQAAPHPLYRASPTPTPAAYSGLAVNLLLIGASTGGPKALAEILQALPADLPAAVCIIQHVDEAFSAGLVEWLNKISALPVEAAMEGRRPQAGCVYLAAKNDHLRFDSDRQFIYTREPADYVYRPSVDVFFDSAARYWPHPGAAALLTGMGRDGAEGLSKLKAAGWTTIAQDEGSSIVFGMPKAAIALNAATHILPLPRIAPTLLADLSRREYTRNRKPKP